MRHDNGWLELSFDAPMTTDHRVDWLKVRDWLAAECNATYKDAVLDPVTGFWTVGIETTVGDRVASGSLYCSDFPDDLCLLVRDSASEELIVRVAERLRQSRPDLGDLNAMDIKAWSQWLGSIRASGFF